MSLLISCRTSPILFQDKRASKGPELGAFNPGDTDVVSAVYVGHDHLAARIRAFIDFLATHMAVGGTSIAC